MGIRVELPPPGLYPILPKMPEGLTLIEQEEWKAKLREIPEPPPNRTVRW